MTPTMFEDEEPESRDSIVLKSVELVKEIEKVCLQKMEEMKKLEMDQEEFVGNEEDLQAQLEHSELENSMEEPGLGNVSEDFGFNQDFDDAENENIENMSDSRSQMDEPLDESQMPAKEILPVEDTEDVLETSEIIPEFEGSQYLEVSESPFPELDQDLEHHWNKDEETFDSREVETPIPETPISQNRASSPKINFAQTKKDHLKLPLRVDPEPYVKEKPEWESPRRVKVTDIVKHFEQMSKTKDDYDARNESRSSGIFSDFDESEESFNGSSVPTSTPHRVRFESTPSPREISPIPFTGKRLKIQRTPTAYIKLQPKEESPTPNANITQRFFTQSVHWDDQEESGKAVRIDEDDYFGNVEEYSFDHLQFAEDDEVTADIMEGIQTKEEEIDRFRWVRKIFNFGVFLYLIGTGIAGAMLLTKRGTGVLESLLGLEFHPEEWDFAHLIVATACLKLLGWFYILRRHFWGGTKSTGKLFNALLLVFQPSIYLTQYKTSKSNQDRHSDESNIFYNIEEVENRAGDSGFLEERASHNNNYEEYQFPTMNDINGNIREEENGNCEERTNRVTSSILAILWLCLIQIAMVLGVAVNAPVPAQLLEEGEEPESQSYGKVLLSSYLIFSQLPQLVNFIAVKIVIIASSLQKDKVD